MPFDKLKYPDELWEERRKGVQESLQPISVTELKKITKQHEEEFLDDPWRDEFLRLIETQPRAAFTRPCQKRTSLFITAVTQTLVSGSCPAVGWGHWTRMASV